jgi:hypothetical protein
MCSTPILIVSDFTKLFFLKCNASGSNLGAFLNQEGWLITFTSKKLCDHNLGKSTHEKEMMDILHEVDTWWLYLHGRCFQIKIDQHSVDGGKNPSQQRETLPVLQVPIRLTNVWYGRLDGIMDPLPF